MKAVFLIGRILYGGFFLHSGINHFLKRDMLAQYAGSKNLPMPEASVTASGAALLMGGASILLGLQPKLGSAAIAAFLIAASPTMHDFWTAEDPQHRQNEMIHFSKNMALLGAALLIMGTKEPWPAVTSA